MINWRMLIVKSIGKLVMEKSMYMYNSRRYIFPARRLSDFEKFKNKIK